MQVANHFLDVIVIFIKNNPDDYTINLYLCKETFHKMLLIWASGKADGKEAAT